ncbi:hypothetical protein [Psychromonas sp. CD1]
MIYDDHEHDKYTQADLYGSSVQAGDDLQTGGTYNPFADLMNKMKK